MVEQDRFEPNSIPLKEKNADFKSRRRSVGCFPSVKAGDRRVGVQTDAREHLGDAVSAECNGEEASEMFLENSYLFELVVTDPTMPQITGAHPAAEILRFRSGVQVLLWTGSSEKIYRGAALFSDQRLKLPSNHRS